jgi:hypothetical protein
LEFGEVAEVDVPDEIGGSNPSDLRGIRCGGRLELE